MATHSGILAWEIPWTEEPGGLQSAELPDMDTVLATKLPPPHAITQVLCDLGFTSPLSLHLPTGKTFSLSKSL